MKKIISALLLSVLFLTGLAACGGGEEEHYENELIIWSVEGPLMPGYEGRTDKDSETTRFILEKFAEVYPDVKVTLVNRGKDTDLHSALQQAFITNDMPDIVVGESFIKSEIELGYFQEIELPDDIKNNVRPELLNMSAMDGKQYGVPFTAGVDMLIYNETLLKQALGEESSYFDEDGNFIVPSDLQTLLSIATTVKNSFDDQIHGGIQINNVTGVSSAFRATYYMGLFGGGWQDANGQLDLVTDENVAAFEYMRDLVPAATFGSVGLISENDIISQFLNGYVAFTIDHPAMIADYTGNNGVVKVAALPTVSGVSPSSVLVGTLSYMMTTTCVNPPAAQAFLEILCSKEVQELIYTQSSLRLPVRTDVQAELLASEDPEVLAVHERYLPGLRALYEGDLIAGLPYFSTNQYTQIWNDNWSAFINDVFTTNNDIRTLLEELQEQISSKLN